MGEKVWMRLKFRSNGRKVDQLLPRYKSTKIFSLKGWKTFLSIQSREKITKAIFWPYLSFLGCGAILQDSFHCPGLNVFIATHFFKENESQNEKNENYLEKLLLFEVLWQKLERLALDRDGPWSAHTFDPH